MKYAIMEKHCHVIRDRLKNDVDAIRIVLTELSKLPLGMSHKSMAEHLVSWNKAETILGLEDLTTALEKAATDCTFAESKMLVVKQEAEEAHRAYIRDGFWAHAGTGQSPHKSDIYKALKIVTYHQHEIEKWQGTFYKKMEELRAEVMTNKIRAQEKLNFRGWEYLKGRLEVIGFYRRKIDIRYVENKTE